MTQAQQLREAILVAPLETSNFGETPQLGTLYLPPSHLKALRLDSHIVVGGRGVGKSFWTAALQSEPLRAQLGAVATELNGIHVFAGFSNAESIESHPNADVFSAFLDKDGDPYDLWRAVVLRWVAKKENESIPNSGWQQTVDWLKQHPEAAARLMQRSRDWKGLILFDALDRTSSDWRRMDDIVRGLLRTVLWLKTFSGLYAKVFLREDQAERTVFNFPDASKLTATKADLGWARHDLHGLLWQRLINAPDGLGEQMRGVCKSIKQNDVWHVAPEMKLESEVQKRAFEVLAGPWMGRDRRRGVPYSWSVGHLSDGRGQTSPRSFLAAIQQAAEDSKERYPQHDYALHFESIKRGIQKASEIRVQEMAEDYPWVPEVLSALSGMNVPAEFDAVKGKWEERFPTGAQGISSGRLPAQHVDRGWDGVREDLQRLGLLETKKDGRIDMPDLYRVGFGLGRKGGVKPKI
ncbi:hypothetical protein ACNF0G_24440 [Pseudomonas aeruginosa]|uniref:hypothetical protein n=1 Tax=Pseudomonas aeruginosa TaxID=287 RepID=UPI0003BAC522|nr:hypothetical protein [Pseudomonas aeruginosa]ELK4800830.1 hypothetical protein [Pseudomonas aeruginosa]ELK4830379.1 hypothetical protein [Pseudomonas aeruginosa]ERX39443.1 hypothetical protein Q010_00185 [Pseudomonas aeruginosa 19660]MBG7076047.1 hypothetical protein [Pseudomonas aeruginosa]MCO3509578.1 hypothetical protein [Pseudomonas aeruginosa]